MPSFVEESSAGMQPVCHIFTPIGMLGYGFDELEMHETLAMLSQDTVPTALIVDSGSTDSGPKKLATGSMTCPRSAYKRDLDRLLRGVREYKVPLLIGSAGGAGTNQHVDTFTEIIDELSQAHGYSFKVIQIYSEISKDLVSERLRTGKISGCGKSIPEMQKSDIDECSLIVGQMGPEPYLEAMRREPDFDVIIGGRAYDPAPYFAYAEACLKKLNPEFDGSEKVASHLYGGVYHSAKIMECGGLCATPKTRSAMSTIYSDGSFDILPTDKNARCTPYSVAAHTLYEQSRPDILAGPGGWLDLIESKYEQLPDGRTVRVCGSVFHSSVGNGKPYQVKLEAARTKGFRSLFMGSHKDPVLINQIDDQLARIKKHVASDVEGLEDGEWDLDFHVHGRESVSVPKSLFLLGECRAKTQELATAIAAVARTAAIHANYPGQKATSGNFAFGIGATTEIPLGPCSEFCIYHLMDLEPGEETSLFRIESCTIDHTASVNGAGSIINGDKSAKTVKTSHSITTSPQKAIAVTNDSGTEEPKTINDIAKVLRSKNAGPYEITFDILFDSRNVYEYVKSSNLLTSERIAALYGIDPNEIIWAGFYDQAIAFKATIPRKRRGIKCANGGYFEDDVHGSQMYIPLMELELPEELKRGLKMLEHS